MIGDNLPQGLTLSDYCYENGDTPQVFDVINIPVVAQQPLSYHVENWLIDTNRYWHKRGAWDLDTTIQNLSSHINDGSLWINGYSSQNGANNRIPKESFDSLDSSLQLIIADDVKLLAKRGVDTTGKKYERLYAYFRFADHRYALSVTDPHIRQQYLHIDGTFNPLPLGPCLMTISIGEPYRDGFAYKLAAHIKPLTPVEFNNE